MKLEGPDVTYNSPLSITLLASLAAMDLAEWWYEPRGMLPRSSHDPSVTGIRAKQLRTLLAMVPAARAASDSLDPSPGATCPWRAGVRGSSSSGFLASAREASANQVALSRIRRTLATSPPAR
jgi:hypothetical protein